MNSRDVSRFVTWCVNLLEEGWLHCGYKGMDVVKGCSIDTKGLQLNPHHHSEVMAGWIHEFLLFIQNSAQAARMLHLLPVTFKGGQPSRSSRGPDAFTQALKTTMTWITESIWTSTYFGRNEWLFELLLPSQQCIELLPCNWLIRYALTSRCTGIKAAVSITQLQGFHVLHVDQCKVFLSLTQDD